MLLDQMREVFSNKRNEKSYDDDDDDDDGDDDTIQDCFGHDF